MEVMTKEFVLDILDVCIKHKYIPDSVSRNFKIKQEYKEMREKGMSGKEAREQLGEKYFIGTKSVEAILYGRGKHVG